MPSDDGIVYTDNREPSEKTLPIRLGRDHTKVKNPALSIPEKTYPISSDAEPSLKPSVSPSSGPLKSEGVNISREHGGAFQELTASLLAASVNLPPGMKISRITEAALPISWVNQKFRETVEVLNSQNIAIEQAFRWSYEGVKVYTIRWASRFISSGSSDKAINADNDRYNHYFAPWDEDFGVWEVLLYEKISRTDYNNLSRREQFLRRTRYLTESGYRSLVSLFYQYALPQASIIFKQACYTLSRDVLREAGIRPEMIA